MILIYTILCIYTILYNIQCCIYYSCNINVLYKLCISHISILLNYGTVQNVNVKIAKHDHIQEASNAIVGDLATAAAAAEK